MSDEIKVNSENTPRKNLATLGQVKDALDKRDEKIGSLKGDLGDINSVVESIGNSVGEMKDVYEDVLDFVTTDNHFKLMSGSDSDYAENWKYVSVSVSNGEKYEIESGAGGIAKLWLLLDNNGSVISYSDDDTAVDKKVETITINNNAKTLVINNNKVFGISVKKITKRFFGDLKETVSVISGHVGEIDSSIEIMEKTINDVDNSIKEIETYVESFVVTTDYETVNGKHKLIDGSEGISEVWKYVKIPVTYGQKYEVTAYAGLAIRLWLLLDNNGSVISYSDDDSSISEKTEIVEINSTSPKTLVVNAHANLNMAIKKSVKTSYVKAENVIQGSKTLDTILSEINKSNVLYGKTLVCCGDSITYGADMDPEGFTDNIGFDFYQIDRDSHIFEKVTSNAIMSYGWQIADRNKMTFYNDGISGSTMQGMTDRNGFSIENGRYTQLPNEIDYLCIFFGWNDTAFGTLGDIDDTTNESYYGGYNVVLPYLINKYPYTKICLIVPFGCDANHRNAVRLLANKWGVACFDMYQGGTPLYYGKEDSVGVELSVVEQSYNKYQANGAHPNYKGHTQIGNMLEHFLRGI